MPAAARWGSITIASGAIAVIDQADIRYGGGSLNIPGGTMGSIVLTRFASATVSAPNATVFLGSSASLSGLASF